MPSTGITAGTYVFSVKAKNTEGSSAQAANFTVVVGGLPGLPTYTGAALPDAQKTQTIVVGQPITTVDLAPTATPDQFFSNPPNSGTRSIDGAAVATVSFVPKDPNTPAGTTSLQNSTLFASSGKTLSISGMKLQGDIPDNDAIAGTYTITFKVKNDQGTSTTGPQAVFTVQTKPGAPVYKGGTVSGLTPLDPGANVPSQLSFGANTYFENPDNSGAMRMLDNDAAVVSVAYQAPGASSFGAPQALNASRLYNGGSGVHVSTTTPTALTGSIPASSSAVPMGGTYRFSVHMRNDQGTASNPLTFDLQVRGVPVPNGNSLPTVPSYSAGDAFSSVDFGSVYANPPDSGTLGISSTDAQEMAVCYSATSPGAGASCDPSSGQSLNASALGAAGSGQAQALSLSNATLSGTVPSNTPVGYYILSAHPHNGMSGINNGRAYTPASVVIHVANTTGVPTFLANPDPASQSINPAQSVQIANVDFGSGSVFYNPSNSGPIVLDATQSADMSVTCTNNHGTACQGTSASALASSPLGGSGGLSIAANAGNTAQLTGNIPASAPAATYSFTVHAKNNYGSSTNAATYTINVEGKPYVYNQDPTKPAITRNGGDTLSLDYAPNYVNPPGSGNLTLSGSDAAQVQVCYQSNCTDLDNSPLGAKDHTAGNYLSVQSGTAVISGKIPSDVTPGDYTINVHANNGRGVSADAVSFVLTVGNVPGAPGYDGKPLPLTEQILDPGQPIQDVDYEPDYANGSYFANAVNSGDLRLLNNDANVLNVVYQAPGQTSPSTPTDLASSNLHALTLSGGAPGSGYENMTLGGTLPANLAAGTYTITARAQNDKGVASTGPSWTLFVRGKPEIKQGTAKPALPTKQIVGIGNAMSNVDFASYYNNPPHSGNLSLDADSPAQVAVAYTPNTMSKAAPLPGSLAASNLASLQVSNGALSGSVNNSAAIEGTYNITTHVANSQGVASDSVPLQIVVTGPPTYKSGSVNPANQFLSPGAAINSGQADFAANFNNPLDGGSMALQTSSLNAMAVQYKAPGASSFGSPTALADSGLAGGLTVDGTALSGSIPASAPMGAYLITVHMANSFGITTPSSPISEGAQIELIVTGTPTWNNQTPSITPINKGDTLSTVSFENNFTNPNGTSDPMRLAASGTASDGVLMVQYQDPSSGAWSNASPLGTALPGLTLTGGDDSTTWRNMELSGSIALDSSVQSGQYKLLVRPANSSGATSTGPDPILTLQGVPLYNHTSIADAHVTQTGQLSAINFYTAFGNPNGTSHTMSLASSGSGNNVLIAQHQNLFTDVWETHQPIETAMPGLVLSGEGDDHGGWSNMILSGSPGASAQLGVYRLTVRPSNNTGAATAGPDPLLYIDGVPQVDPNAELPTLSAIRAGDTLADTDLHTLFGNPDGRYDRMSLATGGTGNNVLRVEYEAPSSNVWGAPTPMATLLPGLTLTGNGADRGGWQNMVLGGTLGAAQPGRYRLLINPGNQSGQQLAGPQLTLSVQGAPIRTGTTVNPVSQSVGGTLSLNFASTGDNPLGYYVNPVDSGAMRIDPQDAQVQQPGSSSLIQFNSAGSTLYNNGQGLTLNNMVLSGTIPASASGTYKLFFRPKNDVGTVASSDRIELDLTVESIPKRNNEFPVNDTFYAGGSFTPEADSTALTLSKYFTPNNQLYFSPNDSSSIAVCPGTSSICLTTLNNAGLGLTYDARQDSPNIQSSELLYPKAYQSKASQQFTMTVTPRAVSQGPLGEPLHYTFKIIGLPVRNTTPGANVTVHGTGNPLSSAIDLTQYFNNDSNNNQNPLVFDTSTHPTQITVNGQDFQNSPLYTGSSDTGLVVTSAGQITGTIPSNLADGTYVIKAYAYGQETGESKYNTSGAQQGFVTIRLNVVAYTDSFDPCPVVDNAFNGQGQSGITITPPASGSQTFTVQAAMDASLFTFPAHLNQSTQYSDLTNANTIVGRGLATINPLTHKVVCEYYVKNNSGTWLPSGYFMTTPYTIPDSARFPGGTYSCYYNTGGSCPLNLPSSWLKKMGIKTH
ncbi:MAG: hypothetical protein COV52_10075 [Gammaproteobacteria bacterium CG11_big_fil_rev_8_21_14_0_20_46_22]|nr:MAG: hypothetical protein COV52_10075 [Gammaproteobacteria bacterium CG11_big_fil_rev_8_21_14_0_20_46_22]